MMHGTSDIYATPVKGVVLGEGITFAKNLIYAESNYAVLTGYESYGLVLTQSDAGWALAKPVAGIDGE